MVECGKNGKNEYYELCELRRIKTNKELIEVERFEFVDGDDFWFLFVEAIAHSLDFALSG